MTNKNLAEYYAKRALEYDNIYNKPELENGNTYEVLKNFPGKFQFESFVNDFTDNVHFVEFEFFWCGHYQLAQK